MVGATNGDATTVPGLIDVLKSEARLKLFDLLDGVGPRKVLLMDGTVVGPLDLIATVGDLKDHGVERFHRLSSTPVEVECPQLIFILRCSRVELIDALAAQIHADEAKFPDRTYHVVFVPCRTEQCLDRLRQQNVQASVSVVDFGLHFFPNDKDVLSMEMPGVFHDFHVQGDPGKVFYMAKALVHLQAQFGVIPQLHSVGRAAKSVIEAMLKLRQETATAEEQSRSRELSQKGIPPVAPHSVPKEDSKAGVEKTTPRITEAIIIDRRVDIYSVLCSQFTYQALIDTVFGINSNNVVDVSSANWEIEKKPDGASSSSQPQADKKKQLKLSSEDPFYAEIRDLHIDRLGPLLQQRTEEIQKVYAEKDSLQKASSKEMAAYVQKFKAARDEHSILQTHINLAQDLKDYIKESSSRLRLEDDVTAGASQSLLEALEDLIDSQRPMHEVLSLLCLYSIVNSGIRQKQLDAAKKQILQAYGYEHLLTLWNLERVGILRYSQGKSAWSSIKRQFNLFVEDSTSDRDISFAYSGYAPLSVRLVQMTKSLPRGWRSIPDALNLLDGCAQEVPQSTETTSRDANSPAIAVVCFLGGVTYGELAALRRLSDLEEGKRKFLVVTTEILSSKKFFEGMRCEQAFTVPLMDSRLSSSQDGQRRGLMGGIFGGR